MEKDLSGFEAVLNAIGKYSWRSMVGVFLATGALLLFSPKLGIHDWVQSIRGWLIFGCLVSGGVLITYIGSELHLIVGYFRKTCLGGRHLRGLTSDEKHVCRQFVKTDGQAFRARPANGAMALLERYGVVFRPRDGYGEEYDKMYDFQIKP